MIKTRQVAIFPTVNCTLNCKLCSTSVPEWRRENKIYTGSIVELKKSVDAIFQIFDYIEMFNFSGGEALLYPHLLEIIAYTSKYKDKFNRIRIASNSTILPSEKLLDMINELGRDGVIVDFYVTNYGNLSKKFSEMCALLDERNVEYRKTTYSELQQDYNGWVDMGEVFPCRNYDEEYLNHLFDICRYAYGNNESCRIVVNGCLYLCPRSMVCDQLYSLGNKADYIDLFDDSISLHEKKNMVSEFGKRVILACQYCNGFDVESAKRYKAAEQL